MVRTVSTLKPLQMAFLAGLGPFLPIWSIVFMSVLASDFSYCLMMLDKDEVTLPIDQLRATIVFECNAPDAWTSTAHIQIKEMLARQAGIQTGEQD